MINCYHNYLKYSTTFIFHMKSEKRTFNFLQGCVKCSEGLANSVDPDQTAPSGTFDLGQDCLF